MNSFIHSRGQLCWQHQVFLYTKFPKGQIISKQLLVSSDSSKKIFPNSLSFPPALFEKYYDRLLITTLNEYIWPKKIFDFHAQVKKRHFGKQILKKFRKCSCTEKLRNISLKFICYFFAPAFNCVLLYWRHLPARLNTYNAPL